MHQHMTNLVSEASLGILCWARPKLPCTSTHLNPLTQKTKLCERSHGLSNRFSWQKNTKQHHRLIHCTCSNVSMTEFRLRQFQMDDAGAQFKHLLVPPRSCGHLPSLCVKLLESTLSLQELCWPVPPALWPRCPSPRPPVLAR